MVETAAGYSQCPTELAAAFDLLSIGVGVFSADYRLTYCNVAFGKLRSLPDALCKPGTLLRDIVRHIATRGDYGSESIDKQVESRLAEITGVDRREFEQAIPGGRHLLISHTPTPGGGLMITYSDVTELRAAERKLRDNEQRYGLVAQAVAEGIYDWNIEQNTLFVSARLIEIFGFTAPELTSQNWFDLVHAEDREAYRKSLRDCFRGESSRVDCEYRILVTSGEYRWVEDHGLPVRDGSGRAIRLVGAVSDVTARKEVERALRESESRHDLALQAVNESIYEWDITTGAMYYSPRLHATLGLTSEQLRTADDWLRRIHPDDLAQHREATRALLKSETERFEVEYRYRHSDGTWHWARQHGLALRDKDGRAIRMAGSTGDITVEKNSAEELARAQRRLHDAIETMAEGFVLFDADDRIVMSNSRYRALFAAVAEEVLAGNSFENILRAAVSRGMFPAAKADPEGWITGQLERRRTAAAPRETQLASGVHLQVSDFTMRDGSHVAVYTDVSERRRREDELVLAKAEVETALSDLQALQQQLIVKEKLASLGQLTAGIAHEIKNPLNFVNNFADLSAELLAELIAALKPALLDQETRAEVEELTEIIRGNLRSIVEHGRRADSIVKNMLLHSREGGGELLEVELNKVTEESLNLAYHAAKAENPNFAVTVETELDANVGTIQIYPQEFARMLLNVISNGFYAAQQRKNERAADPAFQPTLILSTKGLRDRVEIRVRDNGDGIPDEIKSKIFNPFFTTKPAGAGTGLGLSLSHDIVVKQHGGSIDVSTALGEFTEFIIMLPQKATAQASAGP